MRSHEVLRRAIDTIGVKALAAKLRVSPALVYKWCQEYDPKDRDSSGARNPLDRIADVVSATEDTGVVSWLCHEAGGFFVRNPKPPEMNVDAELLLHTQKLVQEFSHLLATVTQSIEDDGVIEPSEADRIRNDWEVLKSTIEAFTVACERGAYFESHRNRDDTAFGI